METPSNTKNYSSAALELEGNICRKMKHAIKKLLKFIFSVIDATNFVTLQFDWLHEGGSFSEVK